MATRFDIKAIFKENRKSILVANPDSIQNGFYTIVRAIIAKANFPNLEVGEEEFVSGGLLFNKEKTKMVRASIKDGKLEGSEVYFRAQVFGNMAVLSCYQSIERGFMSSIAGKEGEEMYSVMREKCKNVAQYEEFVALDALSEIVFESATKEIR